MPDIGQVQSVGIRDVVGINIRSISKTDSITTRDVSSVRLEGADVYQRVSIETVVQINKTPIDLEVTDQTRVVDVYSGSGCSINVSQSIKVAAFYGGWGVAGGVNVSDQVRISQPFGSATSVTVYPATGTDDYMVAPAFTTLYNTQNYLCFGYGDTQYHTGIRFPSVNIPQGATIVSAAITFTQYSTMTPSRNFNIYVNEVDDATAPTDYTGWLALTKNSTPVPWNINEELTANEVYSSPDLTSLVQLIVSRGGWNSGQAMQFTFEDADGGGGPTNDCAFPRSYNSGSGYPYLHVHYETAGYVLYTYVPVYADPARISFTLPDPVVRAYDTMIESTTVSIAELFIITLQSGDVIRWTSHDVNISYGGNTYTAIPIQRGDINYHTGLEVDDVEITFGLVGIVVGTNLYTIPQAVRRELFRNAAVEIWLVDFNTLTRHRIVWSGFVTSDISYGESYITLRCGSILDKLKMKIPRYFYTEKCNHPLFSISESPDYTLCELMADDWEEAGSAETGSNRRRIYAQIFGDTSLGGASDEEEYFTSGKIEFTSGAASGQKRTIKYHNIAGYVDLNKELDDSIAIGDTFKVWPGCDKTGQCCDERFDNYVHFAGFEYIPNPDEIQN